MSGHFLLIGVGLSSVDVCDEDIIFFKEETAYEMRISDRSSDVCSSDLRVVGTVAGLLRRLPGRGAPELVAAALDEVVEGVVVVQMALERQIGRASCRERVCQYVSISVVAVYLKKTRSTTIHGPAYHIQRVQRAVPPPTHTL